MGLYTEAVQKLYVAYFSRPADAAGLAYWEAVITAQKGDTAAVSTAFAASAEYHAAYAGKDAYNVVATIYQNLFGRAPDLAGLNFWGQGLLNKAFTVDIAVTEIAKGALGTDLVAYNCKVAAATVFSAALDTPELVRAYSGDNANAVAKGWLSTVVDTDSLAAAIAPDALGKGIMILPGPVGVGANMWLTTAVDVIAGTAFADIINAIPANATGGASDTLNAADSIDGGPGVDTLNIYATTKAGANFNAQLPSYVSIKNVELINIYNADASAANAFNTGTVGTLDASRFAGATRITQHTVAADVTNLASGTTAGFADMAIADNSQVSLGVTAAATATSANLAATNVVLGSSSSTNATSLTLNVSGAALEAVNIAGTVAPKGQAVANLAVHAGKYVESVTVNTALDVVLTVDNNGGPGSTDAGNDLAGLKTLILAGNGSVWVSNGDGAKLVEVDASGLGGGLHFVSHNAAAETIKLGAGIDNVALYASTYGKVDTVTGLHLVLDPAGNLSDVSDRLHVDGVSGAVKFTSGQTSLDLALKDAAASSKGNDLVFTMGGDTWVFHDGGIDGQVDAADIVVKITGVVDLDALVKALGHTFL
jgi:hypothetical protein